MTLNSNAPVEASGGKANSQRNADRFVAVYAVAEGFRLAEDLKRLYGGDLPDDHPLTKLLRPVDQRGDVAAWGGPHWTVLDALTTDDVAAFAAIVRRLVGRFEKPTITPKELAIFNATALVVRCDTQGLDELRTALIEETRPLLARRPLADEEIQRAVRWISLHDDSDSNRKALDGVLRVYRAYGSPPLPSSCHFRLGFLVRLYKEWQQADGEHKAGRGKRLQYFLRRGEPPWYRGKMKFHLTLASGLTRPARLSNFTDSLWPYIIGTFPAFHPNGLAIVGEDDAKGPLSLCFYDWLTEKPFPEVRLGFRVQAWASFAE